MGFRTITHTRKELELEPSVRQTQAYPRIFFSLEFSRTKCPLGDSFLSRHALFPYRVSPSGKAG